MKVVFVYPAYESLGIEYLSSSLKAAGHETSIVVDPQLFDDHFFITVPALAKLFSFEQEIVSQIVDARPDVVAFSIVYHDFRRFVRLSELLRKRLSVPIVAGGPHCTAVPERVLQEAPCIDYVIVGEGERAFVELVDALKGGAVDPAIPNLCYRRDGQVVRNDVRPPVEVLDSLPLPDKALYDDTPLRSDGTYTIITSRGCTHHCSYCGNNNLKSLYRGKGRFYRRRSVGGVLGELKAAQGQYDFQFVNFQDDLFISDKKWLREFLSRYRTEVGLPFSCLVFPSLVDDETANLLAESGCVKVGMGVQSVQPKTRKNVLQRHGTNEEIVDAIRLLRRRGIRVFCENIISLPGETEDDLRELVRFYNEIRGHGITVIVYWLCYFPKTDILDYAARAGFVTADQQELIERGLLGRAHSNGGSLPPTRFAVQISQLLLVQGLLPAGWVETIVDHRLYRLLPDLHLTGSYLFYSRLLNREASNSGKRFDSPFVARYLHYMAKRLGLALPSTPRSEGSASGRQVRP